MPILTHGFSKKSSTSWQEKIHNVSNKNLRIFNLKHQSNIQLPVDSVIWAVEFEGQLLPIWCFTKKLIIGNTLSTCNYFWKKAQNGPFSEGEFPVRLTDQGLVQRKRKIAKSWSFQIPKESWNRHLWDEMQWYEKTAHNREPPSYDRINQAVILGDRAAQSDVGK